MNGHTEFKDKVYTITQTILALVIIVGGGTLVFFTSVGSELAYAVIGLMGTVIGNYFRGMTSDSTVNANIQNLAKRVDELSAKIVKPTS